MSRKQWIDFTAVREALDFPTVLSHYGIDTPSGQNQFKVHCPFHEDSTPSCSISAIKGRRSNRLRRRYGCRGTSGMGAGRFRSGAIRPTGQQAASYVTVLDTGITIAHPLIQPALDAAVPGWALDDNDGCRRGQDH